MIYLYSYLLLKNINKKKISNDNIFKFLENYKYNNLISILIPKIKDMDRLEEIILKASNMLNVEINCIELSTTVYIILRNMKYNPNLLIGVDKMYNFHAWTEYNNKRFFTSNLNQYSILFKC